MSTHKHFDKICCVVLAFTLILTVLFMNGEAFGIKKADTVMGYESTLFDTEKVHTINIVMDDWDDFIDNCTSEEYSACTVVIDNEAYKNVAIRAKGNTSLTQVEAYGNDRYSFKIEFDHYDSSKTYHGLDKVCLNNIIQDNTYMKDYLTYWMMNEMGVASPLCSYVYVTVNGEDWGLYLAVEAVEEAFLQRNYGKDYGELYKPDSMSMGGGRGNGEKFEMDTFLEDSENSSEALENRPEMQNGEMQKREMSEDFSDNMQNGEMPEDFEGGMPSREMPEDFEGGMPSREMPEDFEDGTQSGEMPEDFGNGMQGGQKPEDFGGGMTNGSDDVLLKYIDDNAESYANIFDNAKTDITDADKERLIQALKNLSQGEELESTVDVEAVIRYFVVHNFVLNFDSYTGSMIHNYYLYEKDGQMQMIPWDYNLAFGGFQSMGDAETLVNYPIDSPVSGGNTEDRPMLAWIFENEEYTELYHQYFDEFLTDYFESGYFEEMIDKVTSMISPYVEKDPTKFCTYDEFETGVSTLKEFCMLRAESVRGQLDGTIGSTSDTQEKDTFVDAGNLQISDMGSMGNTMGGGMKKPDGMGQPNGMEAPDGMEQPQSMEADDSTTSDGAEVKEGVEPPNGMERPDGMGQPNGMEAPDGMGQPNGMEAPSGMGEPNGMEAPGGMGQPNGMNGGQMPNGTTNTDFEQTGV